MTTVSTWILKLSVMPQWLGYRVSIQDVVRHYQDYAQENAQEEITDFLGQEIDKLDFDNIRIILVNQDFSRELTNSVLWLNEQGLDIKCIKITQYEINNELIWDVDTIVPSKRLKNIS